VRPVKSKAAKIDAGAPGSANGRYLLEDQIGYVLRQVSQRHAIIFAELIGHDITPTQWAVLVKLTDIGPTSQNLLGRLTSMDAATIKGVVQRLSKRGLVETLPDELDARRLIVRLTAAGTRLAKELLPRAALISQVTLTPLPGDERVQLMKLLAKMR
jgi:DNA-binding MarR family transcriptional regulator